MKGKIHPKFTLVYRITKRKVGKIKIKFSSDAQMIFYLLDQTGYDEFESDAKISNILLAHTGNGFSESVATYDGNYYIVLHSKIVPSSFELTVPGNKLKLIPVGFFGGNYKF